MVRRREQGPYHSLAGPLVWGMLAGLLVVYLSYCWSVRWLQQAELRGLDFHFQRRGPLKPAVPMVVVVIDEATAHTAGYGEPGAMPRGRYAELIGRLKAAGARLVVLDLLFTTPGEAAGDAGLAKAIREAGNVVLAATAYEAAAPKAEERWIERRAGGAPAEGEREGQQEGKGAGPPRSVTRRLPDKWEGPALPAAVLRTLPGSDSVEGPLAELLDGCRGVGATDIDPDADGRYRHAYPLVRYGDGAFPNLALAAAAALWNEPPGRLACSREGILMPPGWEAPLDREGRVVVNFLGGREALPEVSMLTVVRGEAGAGVMRGAVVLVGSTLRGGGDERPNPYSADFYGVHLNAHLLHSLLTGSFIRTTGTRDAVLLIMLMALLGALIGGLVSPLLALPLMLATGVVWLAVTDAAFVRAQLWVPMASPLLGLLIGYVTGSARSLVLFQHRTAALRAAFERFGVPELAERVVRGEQDMELLYGRRAEVTVLFCDLRGFTRLVERLEVREVVGLLNLFFERVDPIIREHGGTTDKYMGDCIMALFHDVGIEGEHARNGLRAGLAVLREMNLLREEWLFGGAEEEPKVNIGLHSGLVVLGAVGSRRRLQYTAIGLAVNGASELEKFCGVVGAQMLISETVYAHGSDLVTVREVPQESLPERLGRMSVYEVLGPGMPRGAQASSSGSNGSV